MKKMLKLILCAAFLLSVCGCSTQSVADEPEVGGWISSEGGNESDEAVSDSGTDVEEIEVNTDHPLSGLSILIAREVGQKQMIIKVINNSNVCYEWVFSRMYFEGEGLPGYKKEDQYDAGYLLQYIPAYSTTYHVVHAPYIETSVDKGANKDGELYYQFNPLVDAYYFEAEEYRQSSVPMQNAEEYIALTKANGSDDLVAKVVNVSNREIALRAFIIINESVAIELQNGGRTIDSVYDNIVPPSGKQYTQFDGQIYDLNQLYIPEWEENVPAGTYEVFISSAYFTE